MKAFKISAVVLIAAVVCGCVEGRQVGLCTVEDFLIKGHECQTPFIHSLQKNPNSDCSVELKDLRDCSFKLALSCVPESQRTDAAKKILKSSIEKSITKEGYCDQAGIVLPDDQTEVGKDTLKAFCDITMSEYTAIFNRCLKPVVNMWQANKADIRICGEFTKAKKCWNKAMFDDRKCVPVGDHLRKKYDHYNSFCSDGRDPGSAPGSTSDPGRTPGSTSDPGSTPCSTASTILSHKILLFFVPLMKMLFQVHNVWNYAFKKLRLTYF